MHGADASGGPTASGNGMSERRLRLLHTSDWHLGQSFHAHERTAEHACFLDWMVETLQARQPDALLIAGDIFDHANPSGAAQRQFYDFLARAHAACPDLDIAVIAGNHDSAGRLEAPARLLAGWGIRVVGQLDPVGGDPADALVRLTRADGSTGAWCLAVPYLRPGDLPREAEPGDTPGSAAAAYPAGIAATYRQQLAAALARRAPDQALVAMGHLHARGGSVSADSERPLVVGGEEAVDAGVFAPELAYVALGHLHRAQRVEGQERIRYSGSPLPLSFSETNYPHQVLEVTLEGPDLVTVETLPVPRPTPLLRLPETPQPLEAVLAQLGQHDFGNPEPGFEPYLEVRVLLERPEPGLREAIEEVLNGRPVRLVRISPVTRPSRVSAADDASPGLELHLDAPDALFRRRYREQYGDEPSADLCGLFNEIQQQARREDGT